MPIFTMPENITRWCRSAWSPFAAVAQFAPALLIGIFWKGGTRTGALFGLMAGFIVWFYTLFLPSLAGAGLMPQDFWSTVPSASIF
jgi:Na+/proline symporter